MYFHNLHRSSSYTKPISPKEQSKTSSHTYLLRSEENVPAEHRSSISDNVIPSNSSLTQVLLESQPKEFKAATEAPFLRLAGAGKVTKTLLSRWVSQDRLYAETYICFISSLIARVTLPYSFVDDKSKSLRWRIVNVLSGALTNIHHEIDFFTSTAQKYGLQLDIPPESDSKQFSPAPATKQYMDLFRSFFNDPSVSLLEGLVVLWGTEKCYLQAWTFASKCESQNPSPSADADGGALREGFIPNWSSNEFVKFVDEIAEITNALAVRENAMRKLEVYKAVWLHILDIEQRFWPEITPEEEEHSLHS